MILHVCDTATVRVFKEVYELQKRNDVRLLYRNCQHRDLLQLVGSASLWTDEKILKAKLSCVKGGIVHVHTSINSIWLMGAVANVRKNNFIVWDIHDLCDSCHALIPLVDGVVVPSEGYSKDVEKHSKAVIYSKVPADWISYVNRRRLEACLLVSEVCPAGGSPSWRDYTELQKSLGVPLFIMPANATGWEGYSNVMKRLPYMRMLDALSGFKYAWAGVPNSKEDFSSIATNKFWEGLACGCSVSAHGAAEMERLISSIKVESIDSFNVFDGKTAFFKTVKLADGLFMESEISKLECLYGSLKRG